MASIINASTSGAGGVITTADASGELQLQTAGTTRQTIDVNGNVGIGVAPYASWDATTRRALEVGRGGSGLTVHPGNSNLNLQSNLYTSSSGNTYANNGYAVALNLTSTSGSFDFYNYGTGSAGAAATAVLFASIKNNGDFQFNSGYGSAAVAYGCRAWVNFNGTGTVAIRASGNVSSITDNGTGAYTVNFTNAMPDVNYAYCGGSSTVTTDGRFQTEYIIRTTTTFSVATQNSAQNVTDSTYVNLAFFR